MFWRGLEAVAHPASLMWAYYGIGLLSLRQGDLSRALSLLERAMPAGFSCRKGCILTNNRVR
jgi:hypothetical protein